jgi:hypothetical protein
MWESRGRANAFVLERVAGYRTWEYFDELASRTKTYRTDRGHHEIQIQKLNIHRLEGMTAKRGECLVIFEISTNSVDWRGTAGCEP